MAKADELSALIAKTVEEQTFSLDAVKAIGAIRDKAVQLEASLGKSEENGRYLSEKIETLSKTLQAAQSRESELTTRETALAAREAKIADLEKSVAVAQGKFEVLDSAFGRIFANRIVREQTLTSQPVAQHMQGGGSFVTNYDTRNTIDRTEG